MPEGKRQLGSSRRKWEENIEMGLKEMEWGDIDWIALV
jgi:hypothetical protein